MIELRVITTYRDLQLGRVRQVGEVFEAQEWRARELLKRGYVELIRIKFIY